MSDHDESNEYLQRERDKQKEELKALMKELTNEHFEMWYEKEKKLKEDLAGGYFLSSPVAVRESITVVIDCKMESQPDLNTIVEYLKTHSGQCSGLNLVVHYLRDGGDQRRPRPIPPSLCDL